MGQVISIILGRLFGGKKKIESVKPKTGHEEYSPLPSHYIDIIEEHSHKGEDAAEAAATPASFHPRHRVVPISPQQQAVLDPPVEDDLHQPLITTNSVVTDTGGAEETKELILEATSKEATSIDGFQWTIHFTRIIKSTEEESFHPHHHAVTVSQRQQQQHHHPQAQEQEDVSEPLVEVDFHQPLIATNSIVTDTAGVKGGNELILKATTEEPNSTKRFKRKIKEKGHVIRSTAEEALQPHHHVVTVSQQQRHHQQQQEQEVVSDPLVEVDLHQPLITTNSIVANTGGVEETKKLTLKATTKETTSTKRFEWKIKEKEPIIKSTAEEAFHPHHQIVTVSQHQQQQHHHHQQQHQEEEVVSDPFVDVDLHDPLITTNSVATNTARVEETKELILKATTEEATSTQRFKWKIKEKKPIIKSTAEEAFHPHHHIVTVPQHQQQQHHHHRHKHQEEEVVSDPFVDVDLHDPLITTNSVATNTAGVEETKELILKATTEEATSTKRFKWKIKEKEPIIKSTAEEAFHPHHQVVTVSQHQQQQHHHRHRQHQEEEVVSDPLVEVDLHNPLITTNSIATNTARVEETKELILKATTEEATSTKRFKWKIKEKEPIIKSTAEEAFHPHHHIVTVPQHQHQQQQQQHHLHQQQHQEEEVVSDPLVDVNLHNPLITTNSIATNTARVEETKELILKATTEEATSAKSFKWKIKEKKPIIKSTAEEAFHPHHHIVTVSQHQQQHHHQQQQHQKEEVVSDPLVDVDLHNPLITTTSIATNTARVEETKELILKATTKEATPTKRFKWKIKEKESISKSAAEEAFHPCHHVVTVSQHQQQQQHHHHQQHQEEEVVSDPLVEVDLRNPLITTNSIATNTARVEETNELILKATTEEATPTKRFKWKIKEKEPIIKSTAEEAFHPHHQAVTVSQQQQQQHHQQQQHQEEEVVSDLLVDVDLHNPLITTNSIVTNTVGVEETKELIPKATTKEATPTKRFEWKIKEKESISKSAAEEAFHPRHHVVTISQQQQHQQQCHQQQREEEQEVMSNPLVDVDLHKPLIRTNSIVTDIAGVEETKELILKTTTEEATSTKSFKRKIEEKNHKNEKATVRKIGPYLSTQKILLVGEGDFSFSASLAVAFGNASNIVATSLDETVFLMSNYEKSMVNIEKLKSRGALVIHNVDATEMAEHKSLQGMKFDRIIFNFPHTCYFGRTWFEMGLNQTLVVGFLRNAKKMIEEDGEIHVTHKTSSAYIKWHIVQLGLMEDLNLIEASPFDPKVYPGYKTKYGYRGDKNFHYFPCNIYKFGLEC